MALARSTLSSSGGLHGPPHIPCWCCTSPPALRPCLAASVSAGDLPRLPLRSRCGWGVPPCKPSIGRFLRAGCWCPARSRCPSRVGPRSQSRPAASQGCHRTRAPEPHLQRGGGLPLRLTIVCVLLRVAPLPGRSSLARAPEVRGAPAVRDRLAAGQECRRARAPEPHPRLPGLLGCLLHRYYAVAPAVKPKK